MPAISRAAMLVAVVSAVLLPAGSFAQRQSRTEEEHRTGVPPADAWTCPISHPIKGNFTTYSGERCIYHMPGGRFYDKTKPERCYVSEEEAQQDGCRRSKR